MIIVITLILKLTKSLEAGIKETFSSEKRSGFLEKLVDLCDDKRNKFKVIDSNEDYSHILEFKIFYLLGILVFKNPTIKDIIQLKIQNIFDFFERKSAFFKELVDALILNNQSLSKVKTKSIMKSLTKFFEFVYYFSTQDSDNTEKLKRLSTLIILNKLVNEKRSILLPDSEFDVFKWIHKLLNKDRN